MKLTKKQVENLPVPATGQTLYWDDELRGFGVRLTTTGARSYIVQGRIHGKTRRVTLGAHGRLTCEEARRKARLALIALDDGVDPKAEKKRVGALSVTLREVMESYCHGRDIKDSTRRDIEKHVTKSLASWADRPVATISRDACATRFRELSERSEAQANQCFRILRALLNFAREKYRTPEGAPILRENPVRILSGARLWNRIEPKARRIPNDRIGRVWNLLQERRTSEASTNADKTGADIVAFLLLTGARWSEAALLTWKHVDLDAGAWHLPDPKNRCAVTFPLSTTALAILNNRPRANEYVFPSRSTNGGHLGGAGGTMAAVSAIAGTHLSPHDLRRTFNAIAGACGIEYQKAKLLMNHMLSGDVHIQHYTETSDLRYLAPEVEKIAAWIEQQAAIAAADNVVQIAARA